MGEENYGELYFNTADVRPTKTAMDGYQRIRTVGKGEREKTRELCKYNVVVNRGNTRACGYVHRSVWGGDSVPEHEQEQLSGHQANQHVGHDGARETARPERG